MSRTKTSLIPILTIILIIISSNNCSRLNGFLDQSGTAFTIEIETDKPNRDEIIDLAAKVTQSRANAIGLRAEVTTNPAQANQMLVKIFGSNDLERVRKFLFTTNQLELREVGSPSNPSPLQTYPTKEAAQQAAGSQQEVLPYTEKDDSAIKTPINFVIVSKDPIVTGEYIRDAQPLRRDDSRSYYIAFSLTPDGAQKFGDWTGKNIGRYLAVVLDQKVISAPYIKSQIFDQGQIDGLFTKQAAEDLALSLKSGYLPARMKIIEEKPFGK